MINLRVDRGEVDLHIEGNLLQLLAEIPVGFGVVLKEVIGDPPEDLKKELIKTAFELTLKTMEDEVDAEQ